MNNFYEQFASAAVRFPERIAVEVQRADGLDRFTYADLRRMAEAVTSFCTSASLARGDRGAILADNDARWCAAYLGLMRLGAVPVPLDTSYQASQVATLLRDSGAKLLFTTPKYLAVAEEAARASRPSPQVILLHGSAESRPDFDTVLAQPPAHLPTCPAAADDPAVILYSSGTTGNPKGVVLTHVNLLAERDAVFQLIHVSEKDSVLGVLPLFHALAQLANLLLPFAVGARVVFLEQLNSTELLRALREREITLFACVPQFFYLIHQRVMEQVAKAGFAKRTFFRTALKLNGALRRTGANLGPIFFRPVHRLLGRRMRLFVTGGSRFDPAIGRDLYRLGFNILQAYGLTESSGAATLLRPGDAAIESAGHGHPDQPTCT